MMGTPGTAWPELPTLGDGKAGGAGAVSEMSLCSVWQEEPREASDPG